MSDTQQLCEMFSSEDIQSIFILIFILLVRLDGILACLSEEEKLSIFQVRGLPHVSVHADCVSPSRATLPHRKLKTLEVLLCGNHSNMLRLHSESIFFFSFLK